MRCAVWVIIFSFSLTQVISVAPQKKNGVSSIFLPQHRKIELTPFFPQALAPASWNPRKGKRLSKEEIREHLEGVDRRLRALIPQTVEIRSLSDLDAAVALLPELSPYLDYPDTHNMISRICVAASNLSLRKHFRPLVELLEDLRPYLDSVYIQESVRAISEFIGQFGSSEEVGILLKLLPGLKRYMDSSDTSSTAIRYISQTISWNGNQAQVSAYIDVFKKDALKQKQFSWAYKQALFWLADAVAGHGRAEHIAPLVKILPELASHLHSLDVQEIVEKVAEAVRKQRAAGHLPALEAMLPYLYAHCDEPSAQQAVRNILRAEAEFGDVQAFLFEHGQTALRLFRIEFSEGGNSPATWPVFCWGLLMRFESSATRRLILKPENWQSFAPQKHPFSAFEDIYRWDDLFAGSSAERILGRTLGVKTPNGETLGVKLRHSTESFDTLPREAMLVRELNARAKEWGLPPLSYQLYEDIPYSVFYLQGDSLPLDVKRSLEEAQKHPKARPLYYDGPPGHPHYTAFVYKVSSPDPAAHWRYLSDPTLTQEEFVEASDRNLFILGVWARHGLIHPDIIELFHNLERGRRYFSLVDLLQITGGREGAGRLNGWTASTDFPNSREAGVPDVAEVVSLYELMGNPDKYRRLIPDANLPTSYYLSNFLGDYLLSWALIAGRRWRDREEFDWKDTSRVKEQADIIRGRFQHLYRTFTKASGPTPFEEALAAAIDWERLARQMAYYMPEGDGYSDDLLARSIPVEIYGKGVRVIYSTAMDYPDTHGWKKRDPRDPQGRQGWYHDGVHPDLGPYNGPFPPQELSKAIYLYSVGMVVARAGVFEALPSEAVVVDSQI